MNPTICVLLVDDEWVVLDVVTVILEKLGYRVLGAKSGAEAVSIYQKSADSIDIVLLDLNLPDERGEEVFNQIRRINPNARVVLITGDSVSQGVSKLMSLGLRGVLQKPFSLEDLSKKISQALN